MIRTHLRYVFIIFCICLLTTPVTKGATQKAGDSSDDFLRFSDGTFSGWTIDGDNTWGLEKNPDVPTLYSANSLVTGGEQQTGILRSKSFKINKDIQRFYIAGADGTASGTNDGDKNYILLRSYPDGEILRKQRPPGTLTPAAAKWLTSDLVGRDVYIEVVDGNPQLNPRGYAWISLADYRQDDWKILKDVIQTSDLYSLKIDSSAENIHCRTMPFLVADPKKRGDTIRKVNGDKEIIPLGFKADSLYFLGLINDGWDDGLAFWSEQPELKIDRDDQLYIGAHIGDIEIHYADGTRDKFPLTMGVTAWFDKWWAGVPEPFATRKEYHELWKKNTKFRTNDVTTPGYRRYFLAVKPKQKKIESIVIHNNAGVRGRPLVSAINVITKKQTKGLLHYGEIRVDRADVTPAFTTYDPVDFTKEINALADVLYTKDSQLPERVELLEFPEDIGIAQIRFLGDVKADMLSNMWVANMTQMDQHKFDSETGFFRESQPGAPSYGGYMGIGTWAPSGTYARWAFSRCSDHYASLALRCMENETRLSSYVDYLDQHLYYYRSDRDPRNGPVNDALNIDAYPKDAPPHWSFIVNDPLAAVPTQVNEIPGNQELDGHGATITGRWVAWRMLGAPSNQWLLEPRPGIYGKSRWDSTYDSTEFICWLMDYTGRDVIYSEGETTHWGFDGRAPADWPQETDPEKIKENYATADMYEPYPTYVCMTALRCSAQMADAVGKKSEAKRWREYAKRLETGMIRELTVGDGANRAWRMATSSTYPNQQECLVQAWYSIYYDGLDPQRLHPEMTQISRNTFKRNINFPTGHHPVFGFGYGIGWLTKSALILDEMDDAGKLLKNIAKYAYDKNMDYVDAKRNINWRDDWLWLIPEGTNILPDGRWHRIGDLSNGANQGITLHALELCAGVDDTKPEDLKIIPRVPSPLTGIEVVDFPVLVPISPLPDGSSLTRAKIKYSYTLNPLAFELESDSVLPLLSVRLGPFTKAEVKKQFENLEVPKGAQKRIDKSGTYKSNDAYWVWVEGMKNITSVNLSERKGF